jgi:hypothetical protein
VRSGGCRAWETDAAIDRQPPRELLPQGSDAFDTEGSAPKQLPERCLVRLAKREAKTWRQVHALVATRKQSNHDENEARSSRDVQLRLRKERTTHGAL